MLYLFLFHFHVSDVVSGDVASTYIAAQARECQATRVAVKVAAMHVF